MRKGIRWLLIFYDSLLYVMSSVFVIFIIGDYGKETEVLYALITIITGLICFLSLRIIMRTYIEEWRNAAARIYLRLLASDAIAFIIFVFISFFIPSSVTIVSIIAFFSFASLMSIAIRIIYQTIYQNRKSDSRIEKIALEILKDLTGVWFTD